MALVHQTYTPHHIVSILAAAPPAFSPQLFIPASTSAGSQRVHPNMFFFVFCFLRKRRVQRHLLGSYVPACKH